MCSERTREKETETERQRDRDRQRQTETERQRERDRERLPELELENFIFSVKKPNNYSPLMSRYQITGIIYIHIGMNE